MNKNLKLFFAILVVSLFVVSPVMLAGDAYADKLQDAIAKTPRGTGEGQIDPKAVPGFLEIPGAPKPMMIIGFLWGKMGRLDILHSRRVRRHHGRCGTYHCIRSG